MRIVIQGNPSDEEQAVLLARVQVLLDTQAASTPALQRPKDTPWTQIARSEQLNRWPQSIEDRYWHP